MLQVKNIQMIWHNTAIKGCAVVNSTPTIMTEKGRNDAKIREFCD
jgi:hypothetical protein